MNTLEKIRSVYQKQSGGKDFRVFFNGRQVKYKRSSLILTERAVKRQATYAVLEANNESSRYTVKEVKDFELADVKAKIEEPVIEISMGATKITNWASTKKFEKVYRFEETCKKNNWENEIVIYVDTVFNIIFVESKLYNALSSFFDKKVAGKAGERFYFVDDEGLLEDEENYREFIRLSRAQRVVNYLDFINSRRVKRSYFRSRRQFFSLYNEFQMVSLRDESPVDSGKMFNPLFDDAEIRLRLAVNPTFRKLGVKSKEDMDMNQAQYEASTEGLNLWDYLKEENDRNYKYMFMTSREVSEMLGLDWKLPLNSLVASSLIISMFIEEPYALAPIYFSSFNRNVYVVSEVAKDFVSNRVVSEAEYYQLPEAARQYYMRMSRAQALMIAEHGSILNLSQERDSGITIQTIVGDMEGHITGV